MNKQQNLTIVAAVAVVLLVGVAFAMLSAGKKPSNTAGNSATSSSSATTAPAPASKEAISQAVATNDVTIENYSFSPKVIKVKVGDTVSWTNKDSVKHSIVAVNSSTDAPHGELIGKDETFRFAFMKAGTYDYFCAPHPYMKATVIVEQ